jgi:hypothetical protein
VSFSPSVETFDGVRKPFEILAFAVYHYFVIAIALIRVVLHRSEKHFALVSIHEVLFSHPLKPCAAQMFGEHGADIRKIV